VGGWLGVPARVCCARSTDLPWARVTSFTLPFTGTAQVKAVSVTTALSVSHARPADVSGQRLPDGKKGFLAPGVKVSWLGWGKGAPAQAPPCHGPATPSSQACAAPVRELSRRAAVLHNNNNNSYTAEPT
jgi:hypothetical protein